MWQFRYKGQYVTLTRYGAPITHRGRKGTPKERAQALEARDQFLREQNFSASNIGAFLFIHGVFGTAEQPGSMKHNYQVWLEAAIREKMRRES